MVNNIIIYLIGLIIAYAFYILYSKYRKAMDLVSELDSRLLKSQILIELSYPGLDINLLAKKEDIVNIGSGRTYVNTSTADLIISAIKDERLTPKYSLNLKKVN